MNIRLPFLKPGFRKSNTVSQAANIHHGAVLHSVRIAVPAVMKVALLWVTCCAGLLYNNVLVAQESAASTPGTKSAAAQVSGHHGSRAEISDSAASHHAEYSIWSDLPFWSAIAFIGFVLAIKGLGLWDLLLTSMSDRQSAETQAIVQAESDLNAARAALRSSKGRLEALDERIRETMAEAGRDAQSTRDEIIAAADREARGSVERATHEINRVRDQSLNDIFELMTNRVADATESRLRSGLQTNDHNRLIETMLNDLAIR